MALNERKDVSPISLIAAPLIVVVCAMGALYWTAFAFNLIQQTSVAKVAAGYLILVSEVSFVLALFIKAVVTVTKGGCL